MALINCPNCGKQISNKAERCISCGLRLSSSDRLANNSIQRQNYQDVYSGSNNQIINYSSEGQGTATASLILGLFALFAWIIPLIGLPISIAGIITGSISLSKSQSGSAVGGIILSVLGLIGTIINWILGAIMWSQILSNQFH